MAPVMRIDDEVRQELEKRAVELGLIFGTPNQVLRVVLGLDEPGRPVSYIRDASDCRRRRRCARAAPPV